MKLKRLPPVKADPKIESKIKDLILEVFKKEIYIPLILDVGVKKPKFENSKDDLLKAIRTGQVFYYRGKFKGKLNATLSRELRRIGAEWDRQQGSWSIPQSKLPSDVRMEILLSKARFEQVVDKIQRKLESINSEKIAEKVPLNVAFDTSLYDFNKKINKNLEAIGVQVRLSPDQVQRLSEEYTNNLRLYIRNFTEEETVRLRNIVQENVMKGIRYDGLIEIIQDSYGVSANKAKFLARQETNLLLTKVEQVQYQETGLNKYEWRCVAGSANHPVRPEHKALHGKIFSWDKPPNTAPTGKPPRFNHPGEDFNCRCMAIPVLEFE